MRQDDQMVHHRLAWFRHAEEVTHNVAKTCRYFGISRTRYYHWYNRYRESGIEGEKPLPGTNCRWTSSSWRR